VDFANFWTDSNGDPIADRTITEQAGGTIVTTTAFSGETLHTLHIDQVGIPLSAFGEWDFFSG
jgi:hypothetical protein